MSIETIEARLEAATEGPWVNMPDEPFFGEIRSGCEAFPLIAVMPEQDDRTEDFDFIAHSRTDLELLLAVAKAAKKGARSVFGPERHTHHGATSATCELCAALAALEGSE